MKDASNQIPAVIRDYLRENFGEVQEIELLSGLSGASVWRLTFDALKVVRTFACHSERSEESNPLDATTRGSTPAKIKVILKSSSRFREMNFYDLFATDLAQRGVNLPHKYWSGEVDNLFWLVLENIPHPLPPERYQADRQVISVIKNLHQFSLPLWETALTLSPLGERELKERFDFFRPQWTAEMNQIALSKIQNKEFANRLEELRIEAQPLFEPRCFISGDCNLLNWGVRDDDTPVLFDWERFGLGTPLIDLAILMGGLAKKETFAEFAKAYLDNNVRTLACYSERSEESQELDASLRSSVSIQAKALNVFTVDFVRQLKLAKVWNVVEFLSFDTTDNPKLLEASEKVAQVFPQWFVTLEI
jgi:Phosphotransferase enzyme family